jgi:hypothetical protein
LDNQFKELAWIQTLAPHSAQGPRQGQRFSRPPLLSHPCLRVARCGATAQAPPSRPLFKNRRGNSVIILYYGDLQFRWIRISHSCGTIPSAARTIFSMGNEHQRFFC